MNAKPDLRIVLCSPRGFCAGVVRAIDTVERALAIYGAPVYVRHEIVHNRYVVDSLKTKGAIFVEELAEIPDNTNAPVVFSAHGVPKSVPADARARNFFSLDATCPLVTKVHRELAVGGGVADVFLVRPVDVRETLLEEGNDLGGVVDLSLIHI